DEIPQLVPPFEAAFHARMAVWRMDGKPRTARRFTVYKNCPLPTGRSAVVHPHLPQNLCPPGGARALIRDGSGESQPVDSCPPPCAAGGTPCPWRCPRPLPDGPRPAARCLRGRRGHGGHATGGGASSCLRCVRCRIGVPPFAHDGTERRLVRPQDPAEQTECYSGKKKDHTVKNVLLVHALLIILFLS